MATNNIYARHPLVPSKRHFRILLLQPGTQADEVDDMLCASLYVTRLDWSKGNYETISYVWGDDSLPKTSILISDTTVPITSSLASVLRQLRRSDQVIRIWADALCIDQDNTVEKQDQVQLMADIYKMCSQVNVWLLNPEESICSHPLRQEVGADLGGLMFILSADHFHGTLKHNTYEPSRENVLAEPQQFETLWHGFRLLAESSWWDRAWTAQEAFLPPRVVFLHREAHPCSLDIMLKCSNRFWVHTEQPQPCCEKALEILSADKVEYLWRFFQKLRKIQYRRELITGKRRPDGRDTFFFVASSFADRRCRDHRDHVYSLWSMAGRPYNRIAPRYDITQDEAVTSVFECMLKEARSGRQMIWTWGTNFSVFQGFDFGPSEKGTRPSWVPDLSKKWSHRAVEIRLERVGQARLYQTSGWSRGHAVVKGKDLHVTGFRIDTIKAVEETSSDSHDASALRKVLARWKTLIQMSGLADWQTDDALRIRLASLLCADTSHDRLPDEEWATWSRSFVFQMLFKVNIVRLFVELGFKRACRSEHCRRFRTEECPGLEDLMAFLDSGDLGSFRDGRFRGGVTSCISYRALYLTDSGNLGLCVGSAQVGDEVWGISGSRVPFVLRPLQAPGSVGATTTFNMIGDCYLQGAMDGEYVSRRASCIVIQ